MYNKKMNIPRMALLGIFGLAVVGVAYFSGNQVLLRSSLYASDNTVCSAKLYTGGNSCLPCNAINLALHLYDFSTGKIDTEALTKRFKGFLQIIIADYRSSDGGLARIPRLDMFDVRNNSLGTLTDVNQITAKLQELESNLGAGGKCGAPKPTPAPTPIPTLKPTPTPEPRSTESPVPTVTTAPTSSPKPSITPAPTGTPTATPVPPTDTPVLQKEDFTYQGMFKLPVGNGGASQGLAYRSSTNTWFTIANGGLEPYDLLEYSFPSTTSTDFTSAPQATLIKNWGPLMSLNPSMQLASQLDKMKALYWDEQGQKLWFNFGSDYAVGKEHPVFGFVTLGQNQMVMHGPWCVVSDVHSDRARGMMIEAPQELQDIIGKRFLMFGTKASTALLYANGGTGLVAVDEPNGNMAASAIDCSSPQKVDANILAFWKFKNVKYQGKPFHYSDFPVASSSKHTYIYGNNEVGTLTGGLAQGGSAASITLASYVDTTKGYYSPLLDFSPGSKNKWVTIDNGASWHRMTSFNNTTKVAQVAQPFTGTIPASGTFYVINRGSYEQNVIAGPGTPLEGKTMRGSQSGMEQGTWIVLRNLQGAILKQGLLYFGSLTNGYGWYGHSDSHQDPTPDGVLYNNNLNSSLYPGKKVIGKTAPKGYHVEANDLYWFIVNPNRIVDVAHKVVLGSATAQDFEVPWQSAGLFSTLGNNPFMHSEVVNNVTVSWPTSSGVLFLPTAGNPATGKMYQLVPGRSSGLPKDASVVNIWSVQ